MLQVQNAAPSAANAASDNPTHKGQQHNRLVLWLPFVCRDRTNRTCSMQHLTPICCKGRTQLLTNLHSYMITRNLQHLRHFQMQHPKTLDIEYAANLRVHLGAKIAAHFSKIAFPALNLSIMPTPLYHFRSNYCKECLETSK